MYAVCKGICQRKCPEAFIALIANTTIATKPVKDYQEVDDITIQDFHHANEQIPLIDKLHAALDGIMKPVTSGFGFIDLIIRS